MKDDPLGTLRPQPSLLAKIGSIAVHAEEMISLQGHEFDRQALIGLLGDPDVKAWLNEMDKLCLLPKKRTMEDLRLGLSKKRRK